MSDFINIIVGLSLVCLSISNMCQSKEIADLAIRIATIELELKP